jgi:hypothetical protein
MTPLAQSIMKLSLLPAKDRDFYVLEALEQLRKVDIIGYLSTALQHAHCFELTEVYPSINSLIKSMTSPHGDMEGELFISDAQYQKLEAISEKLGFLPSPYTWIEYNTSVGRIGALLYHNIKKDTVQIIEVIDNVITLLVEFNRKSPFVFGGVMGDSRNCAGTVSYAIVALAFINSPKIIGREEHKPHHGLLKSLKKRHGAKFELRPWTIIQLKVTTPKGSPHEYHEGECISGQRALHFVRSFLRVRYGKLEISVIRGNGK